MPSISSPPSAACARQWLLKSSQMMLSSPSQHRTRYQSYPNLINLTTNPFYFRLYSAWKWSDSKIPTRDCLLIGKRKLECISFCGFQSSSFLRWFSHLKVRILLIVVFICRGEYFNSIFVVPWLLVKNLYKGIICLFSFHYPNVKSSIANAQCYVMLFSHFPNILSNDFLNC